MDFFLCDGCKDEYNKQLCESVVHRPLLKIEIFMSRKAKEVS